MPRKDLRSKESYEKSLAYGREYKKKLYESTKEEHKRKVFERKQELKEWFNEYKSTLKCIKCGENHPSCLDFHHLDPSQKESNISMGTNNGWSKKKILEEINKCIVLCANCHRKEHW